MQFRALLSVATVAVALGWTNVSSASVAGKVFDIVIIDVDNAALTFEAGKLNGTIGGFRVDYDGAVAHGLFAGSTKGVALAVNLTTFDVVFLIYTAPDIPGPDAILGDGVHLRNGVNLGGFSFTGSERQ